jgi:hypothetical protein
MGAIKPSDPRRRSTAQRIAPKNGALIWYLGWCFVLTAALETSRGSRDGQIQPAACSLKRIPLLSYRRRGPSV